MDALEAFVGCCGGGGRDEGEEIVSPAETEEGRANGTTGRGG